MATKWKLFSLGDVCTAQGSSNALIKGKQIQKYKSGLYPAFSATGQDIWREEFGHEGSAIIVSAVGARCGKCFKADGKWTAIANTHIIFPKENISRDYLYYQINNENFWEKGGVAQPFVKIKDTLRRKSISIPVDKNDNPELNEQKRIVAILEEAEILKKKRAEADQKMNELIPALFVQIFGDLSKYPAKKLCDFCQVATGNTPSRAKDEFYGSAIEWIKTDNFFEDSLYPSPAREGLSDTGAKIARIVSENSILMTCIAGSVKSIGNVCLTNRRVAFNQQINALTIRDNTNPLFLYWVLKINRSKTQKLASHVLKFIINKTRLEGLVVSIPPVALQNQFVEKVKEIETQKEKQKQSAILLDDLFSSLLSRTFS